MELAGKICWLKGGAGRVRPALARARAFKPGAVARLGAMVSLCARMPFVPTGLNVAFFMNRAPAIRASIRASAARAFLVAALMLSAGAFSEISAASGRFYHSLQGRILSEHRGDHLRGYLAIQKESLRSVPLAEASEEQAGQEASRSSDLPSFQAFLDRMEAESKNQPESPSDAESTASSGGGSDQSDPPDKADPEASSQGLGGGEIQRETIASTDLARGAEPVFPKPERDTENFENIFMYFPIESGDIEKVGLIRGARNHSKFIPPQPPGMKSRAVFERIQE